MRDASDIERLTIEVACLASELEEAISENQRLIDDNAQFRSDLLADQPEINRLRGELQRKKGPTGQADIDLLLDVCKNHKASKGYRLAAWALRALAEERSAHDIDLAEEVSATEPKCEHLRVQLVPRTFSVNCTVPALSYCADCGVAIDINVSVGGDR